MSFSAYPLTFILAGSFLGCTVGGIKDTATSTNIRSCIMKTPVWHTTRLPQCNCDAKQLFILNTVSFWNENLAYRKPSNLNKCYGKFIAFILTQHIQSYQLHESHNAEESRISKSGCCFCMSHRTIVKTAADEQSFEHGLGSNRGSYWTEELLGEGAFFSFFLKVSGSPLMLILEVPQKYFSRHSGLQ